MEGNARQRERLRGDGALDGADGYTTASTTYTTLYDLPTSRYTLRNTPTPCPFTSRHPPAHLSYTPPRRPLARQERPDALTAAQRARPLPDIYSFRPPLHARGGFIPDEPRDGTLSVSLSRHPRRSRPAGTLSARGSSPRTLKTFAFTLRRTRRSSALLSSRRVSSDTRTCPGHGGGALDGA
ncbi:hypothetical protein PsYK624_160820 [Phanerochaete sordida]|uniref:Uncharacterized protein n=1 Tax=Phanerochaete sordida TaxID=48140 RepID=A0A9P3GS44_9APHY|nr:hypothetical protein PsYK624_160820 [Phanerochaete sordida]